MGHLPGRVSVALARGLGYGHGDESERRADLVDDRLAAADCLACPLDAGGG
jgi:hypothetical protein